MATAAVLPPSNLEAALAYARRGWPVFPCHSVRDGRCSCGQADCDRIGKHPRTRNGRDDATIDTGIIHRWWERCPDANVGIATGRLPDGRYLFVLDVDPRHGGDETLGALESKHGALSLSPRALTGGGGQHIYLLAKEELDSSSGRVGDGLDVRCRGGYVLAPPSTHESGRKYEEDLGAPFETPLALVPDWLHMRADQPARRTQKPPGAGTASMIEGNRNNAMASLAGTMRRRGFGTAAIFAALLQENRDKCRPPLDELEVRRIAEGMGRYAPSDPATGADPWNIMDTAHIFAPLPPYPWLLKALHLAPGRVTLLNGYADVGKTVIAMSIALTVSSGLPLWGIWKPERQGPVLHLNAEIGSYIARERYQRLARAMGVDVDYLIERGWLRIANYPTLRLDDPAFEAGLAEVCREHALVVIDSLRAFSGSLDENSKEIGIALLMLARVSEHTGATIIVLHHNRKPSKDDVGGVKMAISGSSSILGGAECAFVMTTNEKGGLIIVHHERSPIGRPLPNFGLRIVDIEKDGDTRWGLAVQHYDEEQLEQASEEMRATKERVESSKHAKKIREVLRKHAGVFRGSRDVFRAACGIGKEPFARALNDMVQCGEIESGGGYHKPEWRWRSNPDSSGPIGTESG